MKIAIMQPYFFPYIGYWQLMEYADIFVIYDNIQYTKKGWINRNRFLQSGRAAYFTVPIKGDSDYLTVAEREVSPNFDKERMMNRIREAYQKAPFFSEIWDILRECIAFDEKNLFRYIEHSVRRTKALLKIDTRMVVSSECVLDSSLKGQDRVIAICEYLNGDDYTNPIGGVELYDARAFKDHDMELHFLKSKLPPYNQGNTEFVQALSIIDVLMFCGVDGTRAMLDDYELIDAKG